MENAVKCFEQAIQIDPNYALAYSGLANVYYEYSVRGNSFTQRGDPKGKNILEKGISSG